MAGPLGHISPSSSDGEVSSPHVDTADERRPLAAHQSERRWATSSSGSVSSDAGDSPACRAKQQAPRQAFARTPGQAPTRENEELHRQKLFFSLLPPGVDLAANIRTKPMHQVQKDLAKRAPALPEIDCLHTGGTGLEHAIAAATLSQTLFCQASHRQATRAGELVAGDSAACALCVLSQTWPSCFTTWKMHRESRKT